METFAHLVRGVKSRWLRAFGRSQDRIMTDKCPKLPTTEITASAMPPSVTVKTNDDRVVGGIALLVVVAVGAVVAPLATVAAVTGGVVTLLLGRRDADRAAKPASWADVDLSSALRGSLPK